MIATPGDHEKAEKVGRTLKGVWDAMGEVQEEDAERLKSNKVDSKSLSGGGIRGFLFVISAEPELCRYHQYRQGLKNGEEIVKRVWEIPPYGEMHKHSLLGKAVLKMVGRDDLFKNPNQGADDASKGDRK